MRREQAKLDEMISAPAGAELRPRAVLVLLRDGADRPIRVQHVMRAAFLEARADAKARFRFDGAGQAVLLLLQIAQRNVQHRHFHAAGNVHADGVRNHGVFRGQHAADGQAVANVRIRHERSRDGDRQQTGFLHLHHRLVFKPFAPLPVFHRLRARRRRRSKQRLREFTAQRVARISRRIGDNGGDFLMQPRLVAAAEDEFGNKIRRPPRGLAERNAQSEKIFGVHISKTLSEQNAFWAMNVIGLPLLPRAGIKPVASHVVWVWVALDAFIISNTVPPLGRIV